MVCLFCILSLRFILINAYNLGQYNIDVTHFDKHLKGSPFTSYVYDSGNVKIDSLPEKNSAVAYKPVSFKCKYIHQNVK